jgi:hypothetical protein
MNRSNTQKVVNIFKDSLDNLRSNSPLPEGALTEGTYDTIRAVEEVDPLLGALVHKTMDLFWTCNKGNFDQNTVTLRWLEDMHQLLLTCQ